MRHLVILALFLVLAQVGCGPARTGGGVEQKSIPRPLAVIVEKTIGGNLGGAVLQQPHGIAVSRSGEVYLSDAGSNRVIKLDQQLNVVDDVGGFGFGVSQFNQPTYVQLDNDLNLAIVDEGNRRVVILDQTLNFVDEVFLTDEEGPSLRNPSGLAINDYGEMWVADREQNLIAVYDNGGIKQQIIGNFGYSGGQLASPEKIVIDRRGDFIVCDAGQGRLVRYDRFGNYRQEFYHDSLEYPVAAAFTGDLLWVLDGSPGSLHCFASDFTHLLSVGPQLIGDTVPLRHPSDIVATRDGTLIVTDAGNGRILLLRVITEAG